MAARIPLFLSNVSGGSMVPEVSATVKLYEYDEGQPDKRGALIGTFSEYPAGSGNYHLDITGTIKGVITTNVGGSENNLTGYEGKVFRGDENL